MQLPRPGIHILRANTSESWRSGNQNTMGGALDRQFPVFSSLGRLYDPLRQLAKRVRRTLAVKEKIVWTDASGYVFATPLGLPRSIAPHTFIGMYGKETSLPEIEGALRMALRERARRWIVDWNAELQFVDEDCTAKLTAVARCKTWGWKPTSTPAAAQMPAPNARAAPTDCIVLRRAAPSRRPDHAMHALNAVFLPGDAA